MRPAGADYICDACAEKNGGVWPRDQVVPGRGYGRCDVCREDKALGFVRDWLWPRRDVHQPWGGQRPANPKEQT